MIRIEDLRKIYTVKGKEIRALDGVSLDIESGEFVAVVGESGSGKTTLLNMIGGLDKPDGGHVTVDGMEITGLSDDKLALLRRKRIGVVYQFYNLIPELTVSENVTLPTELDGREIDSARLSAIIERVGLSGRENHYPAALSGGQQQRVAIARALFGEPSLILADEPTGNLDAKNGREILSLLCELNDKEGIMVVVVTHSAEVAAAAKRVVSISDGRIAEDRRTV